MPVKRIFINCVLVLTVLAFSAIASGSETEDKNIAVMKRFYDEVVNQGKIELIDELLAEDFVEHEKLPDQPEGKAGVKEFFTMFRAAFPDLSFTVEDMVASGDKVWAYITMEGTHEGMFMGVPATGNKISVRGVDIVQFRDGKAIAHWGVTDTMTMLEQMGVISPPDKQTATKE